MRLYLHIGLLVFVAFSAVAQEKPSKKAESPESNIGKVCVAGVGNATTTSLYVDRLSARLTQDLKDAKLNAVVMDSSTTLRRPLQMTPDNAEEMKEKGCDYLLLTQISAPRTETQPTTMPEITIGGARPSTDASDSMAHGGVHRDNLRVDFALFRTGRFEPVISSNLLEEPSGHVTDSMMPAMDRVAGRIAHDLKKKK